MAKYFTLCLEDSDYEWLMSIPREERKELVNEIKEFIKNRGNSKFDLTDNEIETIEKAVKDCYAKIQDMKEGKL